MPLVVWPPTIRAHVRALKRFLIIIFIITSYGLVNGEGGNDRDHQGETIKGGL